MENKINKNTEKNSGESTEIITAKTGHKCPASGEWEVIGSVNTTAILSKSQIMPDYLGANVTWQPIRRG